MLMVSSTTQTVIPNSYSAANAANSGAMTGYTFSGDAAATLDTTTPPIFWLKRS